MNQIFRILAVLLVALGLWRPALAQSFTEVGRQAGVADSVAVNAFVAWGDYDGDGDLDLYVTNWGRWIKGFTFSQGVSLVDSLIVVPNHLYRNNGDGTFTEVAVSVGVVDNEELAGPGVWGDFDNDGDLDLVVGNQQSGENDFNNPKRLYRNSGDGTFTEVASHAGVTDESSNSISLLWGDFDNDGWLDLFVCNAPYFAAEGKTDLTRSIPNHLYQNNQDGTFTDVAASAGVAEFGLVAVSGDDDDDGDLDIYMPGGSIIPNPSRLYRNNGDGTFTDMATRAGVGDLPDVQSITAAWGDYDNDGLLDLYRVNFDAANNLYHNNGDGTFTDVAVRAGVADDKLGTGQGAAWGDYDNDGFLDLYVTNLASSSPCRLFHNKGNGTFTDVGIEAGANSPDGTGAVWGDYDNDGFLDLYVSISHIVDNLQVGAPNRLYHNEGNRNHWLVLQLKGTISNRDAIGARVIAVTGKTQQRRNLESAGAGWGSQPSLPVEFGFGSVAVVDSVIIRWPSGIVQTLAQVPTDQYLTLAESRDLAPTAVLEEQTASVPQTFSLAQNYPNPFNSDTVIRFALPANAEVELGVYDLTGQRVALLVAGSREAGNYSVSWDGRDERGEELASGTYLYSLRAGEREEARKLALVR